MNGGVDVLAISESWLHQNVGDNLIYAPGYAVKRLDRVVRNQDGNIKTGGGVCIFYKSYLNVTINDNLSTSDGDLEMLSLTMKAGGYKRVNVSVVYRPPLGKVTAAIETLTRAVEEIKSRRNEEILILGDLNIDIALNKHPHTRQLMSFIDKTCLCQLIREPTRISKQKASTIDLIFSNMKHVSLTGTVECHISDHLPIFLIKKKTKESKQFEEITVRNYKDLDILEFQNDLAKLNQETLSNIQDVSQKWDFIHNFIIGTLDRHCPYHTVRVRKDKPAFISEDLLELFRQRDRAFSKARRTGIKSDVESARALRRKATSLLRKARQTFIQEQMRTANGDCKKFWRVINDNFLTKGTDSLSEVYRWDTGEILTKEVAANEINHYFSTVGSKLDEKFPVLDLPDLVLSQYDFGWLGPISENDVIKEVQKIDIGKSSGLKDINSKYLRISLLVLSPTFTALLNDCMEQCRFPDAWKKATVVPIPKKGDPRILSNLRPISLLPVPGKIFETFINKTLMYHLESNNILASEQMGFRQKRSTTDCCYNLIDNIYEANNNSKSTIAVFIDLTKAFDTVHHQILLTKLKNIGFNMKFVSLLESYLNNRSQRVIFDNTLSGFEAVETGVPQGSVLGPTLFLCYINDIKSAGFDCQLSLYADDTVLYASDMSIDSLELKMNRNLVKLDSWATNNRLTINPTKTRFVLFNFLNLAHKSRTIQLQINDTVLVQSNSYEYLGIIIDERLSFKQHINKTISACSQKLFTLSKIRRYISNQVAQILYKSLVLSIMDYGNVFVLNASGKDASRLQKVQNRALRIIDLSPRYTANLDLHRKYNILPTEARRKINLLKIMYKRRNPVTYLQDSPIMGDVNDSHNPAVDMVENDNDYSGVVTRSRYYGDIALPLPRFGKSRNSCYFIGPSLWLGLSREIRSAGSLDLFTMKLKGKYRFELHAVLDRV